MSTIKMDVKSELAIVIGEELSKHDYYITHSLKYVIEQHLLYVHEEAIEALTTYTAYKELCKTIIESIQRYFKHNHSIKAYSVPLSTATSYVTGNLATTPSGTTNV